MVRNGNNDDDYDNDLYFVSFHSYQKMSVDSARSMMIPSFAAPLPLRSISVEIALGSDKD